MARLRDHLSIYTDDQYRCNVGHFASNVKQIPCQVALARREHQEKLKRQSRTPDQAVIAYTQRYGRSPPPGFKEWARFAIDNESPIIDDFDGIEQDLTPFRAMGGAKMKRRVQSAYDAGLKSYLEIKDGKLIGDYPHKFEQMHEMISPVAKYLSNLRIPMNDCDEPRVIASEGLDAMETDKITFTNLAGSSDVWQSIRRPCSMRAVIERKSPNKDWYDRSKDVCRNAALHHQFGFFLNPGYFISTHSLFPIVGLSSMSNFADIRAPPGSYWEEPFRRFNKTDSTPFLQKQNKLHWRGNPSGFMANIDTWRFGHRQRLVLLANGLDVPNRANASVAKLDKNQTDIGFSGYSFCENESVCEAEKAVMGTLPPAATEDEFRYRYVFDMDGNSMSGRFYRLLESNALVFKATVQREWHDERLVPWLHFIPISMSLDELPATFNYFANTDEGTKLAQEIADESRRWANISLRRVDLTIHWYRLLIEYASIFDSDIDY
jgi:hypothetical protein